LAAWKAGAIMTADIGELLPPLLRSLTALEFIARHLDPLAFDAVMQGIGQPDQTLRAVRDKFGDSSEIPDGTAARLVAASDETLAAFDGLRGALAEGDDLYAVFRALRHLPRAQEALYPLAPDVPAVNSFFLAASLRSDAAALVRSAQPASEGATGVMHFDNEPGSRGGFSLYVPETYTSVHTLPLVMALHGGSGNGRGFVWCWLRDARSLSAILVAPTATGRTWALMGNDTDTPNLNRILDVVCERWRVDPARLLLTGMSDGGTFCYVSGLEAQSRFTHLAPVSATFHPLMAEMADSDRVRDLPIYLVHGALDWMFPVEVARNAGRALTRAGANVTYRELDDLSHCYPREVNADLLTWLATSH
jgi:phospholipase/carboxylesterase